MDIRLKAFAKINLLLDIIRRRTDNYHDLFMIMQSINIYDLVEIKTNHSNQIKINCSVPGVPCDKNNIAYKSAARFYEMSKIKCSGIEIDIDKHIPFAAGLAGGSADGAAVLVGLNKIYNDIFSESELCRIGATVGADLPFCICGGTMLAQGIGDVLTPLRSLPSCYFLLAKPDMSVSTGEAYNSFDLYGKTHNPNSLEMLSSIQKRDLNSIAFYLENVFEQFIEVPGRIEINEIMRQSGALGVCMSGSGPTIFGIFDDKLKAENSASKLYNITKDVFLTKPIKHGCSII